MGELANRRNSREVVPAANSAKVRMVYRKTTSTPRTHERLFFGNLAAHSNDCSCPARDLRLVGSNPGFRPPMYPYAALRGPRIAPRFTRTVTRSSSQK
jgi:hypothetical protein